MFAIDAQFSPSAAGGTETHVPLQIDALARRPDERFLVIGSPIHAEDLRPRLGANMEFLTYPTAYEWFRPGVADRFSPPAPWPAMLSASGPFEPVVRDLARRRFEPNTLSAAQNDALLRPRGARTIHFPYPQYFETRLPMIYEPWGLPHRHVPETFLPGEPAWIDALMRSGCRRATTVVVGTRWVKDDLIRSFGLREDKIAVLPRIPVFERQHEWGPPDKGAPSDLPADFALFPSALWGHKNHLGLLRAMALLRDEHGITLNLICTGKTKTPTFAAVQEAIAKLGLKRQVRFLGRISRPALDELFRRALFLAHPSRFEGLGLTLVEAMHFGLPIVAARAACIPEVVGKAALLFDPDDPASIAAALQRVITQPGLRETLRAEGRRRLKTYFPDNAGLAARFIAIYRHAACVELSEQDRELLHEMTSR